MTKSLKPKDRKNTEDRVFTRYAFRSGQMHSIHGMANFQVDTQESQFFGLYSNTGQGATEGGPGTGKAVLYTPGQSLEVLGTGLKTRDAGDNTELPAKIISPLFAFTIFAGSCDISPAFLTFKPSPRTSV